MTTLENDIVELLKSRNGRSIDIFDLVERINVTVIGARRVTTIMAWRGLIEKYGDEVCYSGEMA